MVKIQIFVCLALSVAIVYSDDHPIIVLAPKTLKGDALEEAEIILERALAKLASEKGISYKLLKVYKAWRQYMPGVFYRYEVDLMDAKDDVIECIVKIFSQASLQMGNAITFECYGERTVYAWLDNF